MPRQYRAATLVLAGIALTSAGHYLTPPEYLLWHGIYQRLYYLPVIYAAVSFGWLGGLAAALVAGAAYVPHIVITWSHWQHYSMEQYAEIFMFVAVGIITGVLSDRERKRKAEAEQAAQELRRVYHELQDSLEQVKRADRLSAVGELAAGLVHEIRNPLASIDGAAEVLESEPLGEEVRRETVGIIRKECARLNRLLTSLLDFARPRKPELREVDISRVFDSVIGLVSHSAGPHIRLQRELAPRLPTLTGDEEKLTQVVLNLAINAAQAMPGGGVVHLSARERDGGVQVQVVDQGVGIPGEILSKVFDPFFTTKDSGTGLGLPVVHQIVTQHGGSVSVERNRDRGSTFTLFFPQAKGPER